MTRRKRHVVRPSAPDYPPYTGSEPCAQIGWEPYFSEVFFYKEQEVMKEACDACPLLEQCREWALHRERWGFWAGMAETERARVRSQLGIILDEPQYVIVARKELSDEPKTA